MKARLVVMLPQRSGLWPVFPGDELARTRHQKIAPRAVVRGAVRELGKGGKGDKDKDDKDDDGAFEHGTPRGGTALSAAAAGSAGLAVLASGLAAGSEVNGAVASAVSAGATVGSAAARRRATVLAGAAVRTLRHKLRSGGGHTGWSAAWAVSIGARLRDAQLVSLHRVTRRAP